MENGITDRGEILPRTRIGKVGAVYDESRKRQDAACVSESDRETEKYLKGDELH